MDLSKFESLLTGYLRKLAGVQAVGTIWFGFDPNSKPAGVQLYSGQLLSRAAYEAHSALVLSGKRTVVTESEWQSYASAHDGMCPYYSSGDGSTTYRMPCITGVHPKFVKALAEAGQYIEPGAPNIKGSFGPMYSGTATSTSTDSSAPFSFSKTSNRNYSGSSGSDNQWGIWTMDLSTSSTVYRDDCDTIQPPALTHLIGEYVVGSVATLGEADAESLLASVTTLESNVGTLESNVQALESGVGRASAYIVETWHEGTEWYRVWSDGWIEQGGYVSKTATVTLLKAFSDTDYTITGGLIPGDASGSYEHLNISNKTVTTFYYKAYDSYKLMWRACGY